MKKAVLKVSLRAEPRVALWGMSLVDQMAALMGVKKVAMMVVQMDRKLADQTERMTELSWALLSVPWKELR